MSGVTPSPEKQVEHAETHIERTFAGYPDKDRLQRAMSSPDWRKTLWKLADELGYDPTSILEKFRYEVYGKFLGFDCPDLTQLVVPALQEGFNWVTPIVAIHLTMPNEAIFQAMKKQFGEKENSDGAWKYTDKVLDEVVTVNDRDPLKTGPYVIRVRDRVEADEELKSNSAEMLGQQKIPCQTLYERQVLEAFYYVETGKHLDVENATLCAGSRDVYGHVPYVYWGPGRRGLYVSCVDVRYSNDSLRGRQVVS